MASVTANGHRFNLARLGEGGPAIVCIHGLLLDNLSSFYYTIAPGIAQHGTVFMYDLRGHGRSELTRSGYGIDDSVTDLLDLLDELQLDEPVHLVGNSYGGYIALRTAIDHPDRVASLTLIEAHYPVEGWAEQMVRDLKQLARQAAEDATQEGPDQKKRERFAQHIRTLVEDTSLLEEIGEVEPLSEEELSSLSCPVLAIYGEDSDLTDRGTKLRRLAPDCELHVLAGATHFALLEEGPTVESHLRRRLELAKGEPRPGPIR